MTARLIGATLMVLSTLGYSPAAGTRELTTSMTQAEVCHVTPDANPHAITVDDDAVPTHLAHGDCRGDCSCLSTSICSPRTVRHVHAKSKDLVLGNARLARIENGRVACVHIESAAKADCVFTPRSGAWVETDDGEFALAGQAISLEGRAGGEYVVAARVEPGRSVACVDPTARDAVGTAVGQELAFACTMETLNSPVNTTGTPLVNYATREVCTSSSPHPDGALFTRMNGTSYCYTGVGAALNDINGTERDQSNVYYPRPDRCHVIIAGGYEMPAAKRPATGGGYPVKLNINSPIVWRPVSTSLSIAQ